MTESSAQTAVQGALADAPLDLPESDRPALEKLTSDQMQLLGELLDGFQTRRAVIRWMQSVAVQSLGHLGDGWFVEQATDPTVMSAFVDRPWGPVDEAEFSEPWAAQFRRDIAAKDLLGAFHDATRSFRWSTSEQYDQDAYDDVDDLEQQHPAMRPAMSRMQRQQRWAVDELLAGFEDADALLVWAQFVTRASYAEIERTTLKDAYFEQVVREWLTSPADPRCRFWRETWAVKYLLPGFNRAANRLSSRAAEIPEDGETDWQTPR